MCSLEKRFSYVGLLQTESQDEPYPLPRYGCTFPVFRRMSVRTDSIMTTRTGELTARRTVNIPYCCACFSEEAVQILTTFQTVLAPLGLQASAGKQRVLISRPQPNRFIPGQDSACEKSTQACPALAPLRSDKVRKDSHTRLVCPIPATRGPSP